jgi:DNA-binding LacI/PurR family transcriptional regulator
MIWDKMDKQKKVTIKDVAKLAGVTPAVVSRVSNNDTTLNIREETRIKVLRAINELNYKPNAIARSLRKRSMKTIGMLITDIINPFYSQIIKGVQSAANKEDYCIILCDTNDEPEAEKKYIELLNAHFVDGIILGSSYIEDNVVDMIERLGIKYVMVNRGSSNSNAPYVKADDEGGMVKAVNYLIGLGHKKIAYLSGPLYAETAVRRLTGYRKALHEAEIQYNSGYVIEGAFDELSGYKTCKELLKNKDLPTAICCCNDLMAIGAMRAIKEAGLSVPDDISLVGCNGIWITSILATPLTTINYPLFEMGRQAFKVLMGIINKDNSIDYHVTLPSELVVRESTTFPRE